MRVNSSKRKAVSLFVVVVALSSFALLNVSNAYAIGATFSPKSVRVCQYDSVTWSISWSGTAPFVVTFDSGGDEGGFSVGDEYGTSDYYSDYMSRPGTIGSRLEVSDYWDDFASSTGTTYVNQGGTSGCPL